MCFDGGCGGIGGTGVGEAKQQEAAKKPIPQKINIAELQTKKVVPVSENTEPENVETVDIVDEEPTTIDGRPVDNIARLRQKMLAQKRLERELMEKERRRNERY